MVLAFALDEPVERSGDFTASPSESGTLRLLVANLLALQG
jgi:hypothetical protein